MKQFESIENQRCGQYLSPYLQGILEAEKLIDGENYLYAILVNNIKKLKNNAFINTSELECIIEWEKFLGITGIGTIEKRRQDILDRLSTAKAVTEQTIRAIVADKMGDIPYTIEIDCVSLEIRVITDNVSDDKEQEKLEAVRLALLPIIPLNILLVSKLKKRSEAVIKYNAAVTASFKISINLEQEKI